MDYRKVLDTTVLTREEHTSPAGRHWAVLEVAYPEFTYAPGQFVMIGGGARAFRWSYPYMVQSATSRGFTIVCQPATALYDCRPGTGVAVWGANGKPVPAGPLTLVAQPESYHFVAPLLKLAGAATLVMLGGEAPEAVPAGTRVVLADGPKQAAEALAGDGRAALALNLPQLLETMAAAPAEAKDKALVFAYTRAGCGIGACRGCYLHDPDIQTGVAVCCEGPYMPYNKIDFETDRNCFQVFS